MKFLLHPIFKSRLARIILIILTIFTFYLLNEMIFVTRFYGVQPLTNKLDAREALYPYGVYKEISLGDKWEIWRCSSFPLRSLVASNSNIDRTSLREEYEDYEILFDENGSVCLTVQVGEQAYMNTNLGEVKGSSIEAYFKFIDERTKTTNGAGAK